MQKVRNPTTNAQERVGPLPIKDGEVQVILFLYLPGYAGEPGGRCRGAHDDAKRLDVVVGYLALEFAYDR